MNLKGWKAHVHWADSDLHNSRREGKAALVRTSHRWYQHGWWPQKKSPPSRFTKSAITVYLIITCHMQHTMTCTACGTSCFNMKQVCNTDSPRRICSPNSCDTLPALWSVPVLTGSGTSSVFNLHTQDTTATCILSTEVTFYWFSSCNSTGPLFANTVTWNGQMVLPSRSKLLDSIHILQQTTLTHWFLLQWKTPK